MQSKMADTASLTGRIRKCCFMGRQAGSIPERKIISSSTGAKKFFKVLAPSYQFHLDYNMKVGI